MSCQKTNRYVTLGLSLGLFHLPFWLLAICVRAYKRKVGNLVEVMVESVIVGVNVWLLVMGEREYEGNDKAVIGFYLLLGFVSLIFLVILADVVLSSC